MTGFGDLFGTAGGNPFEQTPLGQAAKAAARDAKKPTTKPLPQIRGKHIDGVLYVRAEDVAAALEVQAPAACTRLIRKLRGGGQ